MEAPQPPCSSELPWKELVAPSLDHGTSVWGLVTATSLLWAELEPSQNLNLVMIS